MIRLPQPERAAMVMQQAAPVGEARRDQRVRDRHRIARIQQDDITVLADSRQRCPRVTRKAAALDGLDEVLDLLLRHHRNLLQREIRACTSAGFQAGAMCGMNFWIRAATSLHLLVAEFAQAALIASVLERVDSVTQPEHQRLDHAPALGPRARRMAC